MSRDEAEALALTVLAHIAGDQQLLEKLLQTSGLAPDDLRRRAADPALLAGVLDFLLADESALLVFCEASGVAPDRPARARVVLA